MEAEQATKKKKKAEKRQERKINLAQITAACNALLSLITCTYYPLLSPVTSASGTSLSLIAGGDFLSAVLGCLSTIIADSRLFSIVSGCFLSLIASSSLFSAISGGDPLFPVIVASSGPLFTIFDSCHLSPILPIGF